MENTETFGLSNRKQIEKSVINHYKEVYPEFKNIRVTEIVLDVFGGSIAVIRAEINGNSFNEELCFVYPENTVRHFHSTEELARFLESKGRAPLVERIFTRPIFSGIIFLVLLLILGVLAFSNVGDPPVVTVLGSAFGLAAGFFFGGAKRD